MAGLNYKKASTQIRNFTAFAKSCEVVNISRESTELSAKFYGNLRRKGVQIGTSDLLIAGIAVVNDFELVTNNRKHFEPIEELSLAVWK